MLSWFRTVAGRLTLWYAAVFSLCFLVVFGLFYFIMRNHFHRWTDAQLKVEISEVKIAYQKGGIEGVEDQLKQEDASEAGRFVGRIINPAGVITYESANRKHAIFGVNPELLAEARTDRRDVSVLKFDHDHAMSVSYSLLPDGSVVQVGLGLLEHEIWLRQFTGDLGKVAILALLLSTVAGGVIATQALAPIRRMAIMASSISGRSLGQRVPQSGHKDEVDQLAKAFNGMLDRIDTLVDGLCDVTDTLAHDLRTPITGIRGLAEVTLRVPRDEDAYRLALYQIIDRMDHLLALAESILDVAEVESGAMPLQLESVSLDGLVSEMTHTFRPVAKDKGIHFESALPTALTIMGDKRRLGQAIANLIDNALKFTPRDGRIWLGGELGPTPEEVTILVADSGPGISDKDLPHIFERYYRGDKSRSGTGMGLGLPLVNGIVKAHGGRVTVENQPGSGAAFKIILPREISRNL